jgi:hypothetical protein
MCNITQKDLERLLACIKFTLEEAELSNEEETALIRLKTSIFTIPTER